MSKVHYTIREIAAKKGVSRQTVYSWIQSGQLKAIRKDIYGVNRVLVHWRDFERFTRPSVGRPLKYFQKSK